MIIIYLQTLIEHLEDQNLEGYTEAVKEYDSISRLDQWYTTVLLRIKKQIHDNPDLRWSVVSYLCYFLATILLQHRFVFESRPAFNENYSIIFI